MASPMLRANITRAEELGLNVLAARLGKSRPELLGAIVRLMLDWAEYADATALASMLQQGIVPTGAVIETIKRRAS